MQTVGFKFDKPVRKKRKKNHSIRNKRRTKRGMVIDLDKWARKEIVEDRDHNACQRCGAKPGEWYLNEDGAWMPVVIQWCHVHTREYYITRWEPDNSFAGCSRCHVWFDQHKMLGFDWYAKAFSERWERVARILNSGNNKTTDADIRALWEARRIP